MGAKRSAVVVRDMSAKKLKESEMTNPQPSCSEKQHNFSANEGVARNIIPFDSFHGKANKQFFDDLREGIKSALDTKQRAIDENWTLISSLQKTIEEITGKLHTAHDLENKLCALLINHAGETGQSEGAVEVLERKLRELESLRAEVEREKSAYDTMLHEKVKVIDEKWYAEEQLSKCQAQLSRLREALERVGNILGGPTMGYASTETQLMEREKMAKLATDVIKSALAPKDSPNE